jgi:hypothetical protein
MHQMAVLHNGIITLDGYGDATGASPGAGKVSGTSIGGGGYGGNGGSASPAGSAGQAFGSLYSPLVPGSAGGRNSAYSSYVAAGGGVLEVSVTGAFVVDGFVHTDGLNGVGGSGGGSGGSILVNAGSFGGQGNILSNGGTGSAWSSYSGGGMLHPVKKRN